MEKKRLDLNEFYYRDNNSILVLDEENNTRSTYSLDYYEIHLNDARWHPMTDSR